MEDYFTTLLNELGIPIWFFITMILWSNVWKMLALWKSARNNSLGWFVIFALCNTVGILEILYIFGFSKINLNQKKENNNLENKKQNSNSKDKKKNSRKK